MHPRLVQRLLQQQWRGEEAVCAPGRPRGTCGRRPMGSLAELVGQPWQYSRRSRQGMPEDCVVDGMIRAKDGCLGAMIGLGSSAAHVCSARHLAAE
ncbi:hypothetical protein GDO81_024830 [Engystomops pustulosus]|uniref:Uncharacterized protein n=1 Tax=Engystomops pustulosus TaxID=76066 RepID=A0AAV6Z5B9_ENGPU|nr:hypothetical protein GDO81_024830 [Engystomops pustulosus]